MTNKSYAVISTVAGLLVGLVSFFIFTFFIPQRAATAALLTGLLTAAFCFPAFIIIQKLDDLKYKSIEKSFKNEIVHSLRANVITGKTTIYAKVYFTEKGIVFAAFRKKKPIVDFICFKDVAKVVTDGAVSLEIYMKSSSVFRLLSAGISDVLPFLKKHSAHIQNDM